MGDPRTAWGVYALLEIVRSLPMVLTDLTLRDISLEIHVTIGRVLFSDPIAFVDVIFRRTYSNLKLFSFT